MSKELIEEYDAQEANEVEPPKKKGKSKQDSKPSLSPNNHQSPSQNNFVLKNSDLGEKEKENWEEAVQDVITVFMFKDKLMTKLKWYIIFYFMIMMIQNNNNNLNQNNSAKKKKKSRSQIKYIYIIYKKY